MKHPYSSCDYQFPDPLMADPSGYGLIAYGGDLRPKTLRYAYAHGLFPWFNQGEPIAWWSPEPRCVIEPMHFQPSKSLSRKIKNSPFDLWVNRDFVQTIQACAKTRADSQGTWIGSDMIQAYTQLYQQGTAYSVEIWEQDELIGGLYGLKLGQAFFGESMFHKKTDTSKMAFWGLMKICQLSKFAWVDCQLPNPHLLSLGAKTIPRSEFLSQLAQQICQPSCDWSAIVQQPMAIQTLFQYPTLTYDDQHHAIRWL